MQSPFVTAPRQKIRCQEKDLSLRFIAKHVRLSLEHFTEFDLARLS